MRDNYKFKETVHIPGARCLYLRFDSRCSSQYDYDKVCSADTCVVPTSSVLTGSLKSLSDPQLVIYAGPNTNSRKVTEYGGNTLGYGSRSVLGTGWPKDLVKVKPSLTNPAATHGSSQNLKFLLLQVEGDTVTFSFEMRSGREHNTPDKAMWGFSCTVRAQVSP